MSNREGTPPNSESSSFEINLHLMLAVASLAYETTRTPTSLIMTKSCIAVCSFCLVEFTKTYILLQALNAWTAATGNKKLFKIVLEAAKHNKGKHKTHSRQSQNAIHLLLVTASNMLHHNNWKIQILLAKAHIICILAKFRTETQYPQVAT